MIATQLQELIRQKDKIEKEIAGLATELELMNETKGFNKGMVDSEGFPRNDLDFGEISHFRNLKRRKAELNNDHLALMKEIEKGLFALHETYPKMQQEYQPNNQNHFHSANFKKNPQNKPISQPSEMQEQKVELKDYKIEYLTPFAKISIVDVHSPAEAAGMKVGDLLSEFSEVNIYTMEPFKQIPRFVKEGLKIKLILLRKMTDSQEQELYMSQGIKCYQLKDKNHYAKLEIEVIPSQWIGKGLLGCKIDPI